MHLETIDAILFKEMMASGTASLYAHKAEVDALNVFPVPDGDTGTNMSLTFQAALREVSKNNSYRINDLLEAAAYGALMGARGNSGVIVSQFFRGFIKALPKDLTAITKNELALGFNGASTACFQAVRQPVEGTILTVIREVAKYTNENLATSNNLVDLMKATYQHAVQVLAQTPEMLPVLKQAGVVDAGGQGLVYFLKGFVEQLSGEFNQAEYGGLIDSGAKVVNFNEYSDNELLADATIDLHYCTEFILKGKALDLEYIKNSLSPHGDCLLVVGDENTAKIHIHTNNPGIILDFVVRFGEMSEIQISNMVEQSQQRLAKLNNQTNPDQRIGIVAVTTGDGLERIFRNLGVQKIVNGGQTMNPSIEDLAKAVDNLSSPEVIILPNNSNIVATANHVHELTSKTVRVVPTGSIPEGLAAMLNFSDDRPIDENVARMSEKGKTVTTGEITYAVRSTQVGDFEIRQGDIIGLINGKIVTVANTPEQVIEDALKQIPSTDGSLITIYYGVEVTALTAQDLLNRLEAVFPETDIELYYGGQPLYYYLFSVE